LKPAKVIGTRSMVISNVSIPTSQLM